MLLRGGSGLGRFRQLSRVGLWVSLGLLGGGLTTVAASAAVAGDWWLAQQPLIGLGLNLLVLGLATTAVLSVVRVVIEPLGRWRLISVVPAVLTWLFWLFVLAIGYPTTGRCDPCPRADVQTLLYSFPALMLLAVVVTLLIPLPLFVRWTGGAGSRSEPQ
jgi:hypothetical protein